VGVTGTWLRIPPEAEVEARTTWTIAVGSDQAHLGSAVILLNRPCESVADLTAAEWMDLHTHLQRVHRALDQLLSPDTYDHAFHMSRSHQVYMEVVPRYRSPRHWLGETFEYSGFEDDDVDDSYGDAERSLETTALRELRDAIRDRMPAVV
jgi:diadenosine tetraphosphate (Ap4A) HIT family hydrolase